MARVVAVGIPHHITQRGNQRRDVFLNDELRQVYLDLLAEHSEKNGLRIQAYCIMTNHLHIVAIPERERSLASDPVCRTQSRAGRHGAGGVTGGSFRIGL